MPQIVYRASSGLTHGARRIAELPLNVRAALATRLRASGKVIDAAAWLNRFVRDNRAALGLAASVLSFHPTDVSAWWRDQNTLARPRTVIPPALTAAALVRPPLHRSRGSRRVVCSVKRRLKILADAEVIGLRAAARRARVSAVTIWRWRNLYRARGAAGLSTNFRNCGRHGVAESLTPGELGMLRRAYRRTRSLHAAVASLSRAKVCTTATRLRIDAWISRGSFPGSLIRAVQHDDATT